MNNITFGKGWNPLRSTPRRQPASARRTALTPITPPSQSKVKSSGFKWPFSRRVTTILALGTFGFSPVGNALRGCTKDPSTTTPPVTCPANNPDCDLGQPTGRVPAQGQPDATPAASPSPQRTGLSPAPKTGTPKGPYTHAASDDRNRPFTPPKTSPALGGRSLGSK
jgi:hypothetical protein